MRGEGPAGVALVLLCGVALGGCSPPAEDPKRTRAECRESPALAGCSLSLPADVVEARRERAVRQADRRADRNAEKVAVKARRWLRQAQKPDKRVTLDDFIADYINRSEDTSTRAPEVAGAGGLALPAVRRCSDVTSYDYDWGNDVLCQRVDGSQFHTSYAGANAFLSGR